MFTEVANAFQGRVGGAMEAFDSIGLSLLLFALSEETAVEGGVLGTGWGGDRGNSTGGEDGEDGLDDPIEAASEAFTHSGDELTQRLHCYVPIRALG